METLIDTSQDAQLHVPTFDGPLGRAIIETHIWAVRGGLGGATAHDLFDGYCQRLVIHGVPLWRAHTAMETLHPQWRGITGPDWLNSPMYDLICRARNGEDDPWMRRRLEIDQDQRDFPVLEEFCAQGATDYFAQLFAFGEQGDPSQGTGVVYSFASDRRGGFEDNHTALLRATLPGLSLAMKAHAGHIIASALLRTYLGEQTGRRVHAGAIERGSVESLHAVLWFADIRGFTPTSDASPGPIVIELLNSVFEVIAGTLRSRGGEVLKFLGDGVLATLSFKEADRARTCQDALDAAAETMRKLEVLNEARAAAGLPTVTVDLALHVGEVLYGNVGATDRLDFTVIGPAVNEVTRIEALCEALRNTVLVSAEFAAALGNAGDRLISLGHHRLRGIREAKEIFAPAPSIS